MKVARRIIKAVFVLYSVFFLPSCDYLCKHDFLIKNDSSKDISFSVKNYGDDVYNLKKGESLTLQLYDHPNFMLNGGYRITYDSGVDSARFYDMNSYNYEFSNYSAYDIVVSEKNNFLTDEYGGTEIIPAATFETVGKKQVKVYTSSPIFEAYYIDGDAKISAANCIVYAKIE